MPDTAPVKLRVLLADDHEMVREGLRMLVNSQPDMQVVGTAHDGNDAVTQAEKITPDVVLMDISMPGLNGLAATAKLIERCPGAKVVTLTRHADNSYLQQLMRAGASGYVLKQSRPSELLHAIRAVAGGGKYLDAAMTGPAIGSLARPAPPKFEPTTPLSPRETEVLRMIAWGNTNKEIAARLDLSVKTVEAHKANGMRKLGMRGRIDIVRYALLQGWLHES
ncbi:MAG TPA: response regulator transcription factor [Vicinamibacterales bacterium]|nr:response regulator transcription factor [Vicinamibacterales bacterium]